MSTGTHTLERRIIGRIFWDGSAQESLYRAYAAFTAHEPEDFEDERNRLLFSAMKAMAWAGRPMEMPSVADLLAEYGLLEAAGGAEYLVALVDDYIAEAA
jgi:replicative DNA helicase